MSESNAPALIASAQANGSTGAPEAAQQPLGYKEMIEQAYVLAKTAQTNTLRFTVILEDILTQIEKLQTATSDVKKQLASIYKLSEAGTQLSAENVSKYIVTREAEALQRTLTDLTAAGALKLIEKTEEDTDIIAYKTKDVTFGYMSLFAFPEGEQAGLKGKGAGETVGEYEIVAVYREAKQEVAEPAQGATNEQKQDEAGQQ